METSLAIDLARFQFAFTVSFHIIFPSFSIGLASYLAVLEGLWLATGRQVYLDTFRYWLKIFAVAFAMGVVSGIVMSYQFGTNWSVFSDKTGPILGPLMGYEVLSAFFLEAGFLGVMLFGMNRVGPRPAFSRDAYGRRSARCSPRSGYCPSTAGCRRPQVTAINDVGQFVPEDWWAIVFNPSFPYRLVHMVLAAYLTTALVVGAVGAVAPAARQVERGCATDVFDGDVDGGDRRADPDRCRRHARPQHARASAGEDRCHGRPFRNPQGRAADPVRHSGHGRRGDEIRNRDSRSSAASY